MRTDGVVDALPGTGLAVEAGDRPSIEGTKLIELLGMGALGALDRAVELGRTRRQHEQAQAAARAFGAKPYPSVIVVSLVTPFHPVDICNFHSFR